jgi:nitroreductase
MKGENPSAESLERLIMTRRSIRKYKDKQVPRETIERLLDAAVHAGTASNNQAELFLVLQDKEKIQALEVMVVETLWNAGLKYLGKDGLMKKLLEKKYGSKLVNQLSSYYHIVAGRRKNNELQGMIFRNAPTVIIAAGPKINPLTRTNCALAFRNMELLAQTMNLGTCMIGFIVAAAEKSKKIDRFFDLPKDYTIGGCIILGYPVYDYAVKIPRKTRDILWL